MISEWTELKNCLVCEGPNLKQFISFGMQPLPNIYKKQEQKYPLLMNFCTDCSHIQVKGHPDLSKIYKKYDYINTAKTLTEHHKNLVWFCWYEQLVGSYSKVLDVGGNSGSLASEFRELNIQASVLDPAEKMSLLNFKQGIPFYQGFLNKETALKIDEKFDLITALNVLPHGPNPKEFLESALLLLKDSGHILIEFVWSFKTLLNKDLGQFYLEHMSMFSLRSFITLIRKVGLSIVDFQPFDDIHGGTLRFVLTRGVENKVEFEGSQLYSLESKVLDKELLDDFVNEVGDICQDLYKIVGDPLPLIVYGSSAKLVTLLNLMDFLNVATIVDDNPLKIGKTFPGFDYEIQSPEVLRDRKDITILCGAYNFKEDIKKRLRELGVTGKLVLWTPEVYTEDI